MKKRLLITSIVMMLVVAVALSTATYAWFTSNNTVDAASMTLKASVSEGSSLAIGWLDGNNLSGTSIDSDVYGVLLPMAPHDLTVGTTKSEDLLFRSSTIREEDSQFVFNGGSVSFKASTDTTVDGSKTYYTTTAHSDYFAEVTPGENANPSTLGYYEKVFSPLVYSKNGVQAFYIKNSSSANSIGTVTVAASFATTDVYVLTRDVKFLNKTYYTRSGESAPYTYSAASVTAGDDVTADTYYEKVDGNSLVRVAIFTKPQSTGANTSADYTLLGVLGQTKTDYTEASISAFDKNTTYYTRSGSGTEQSPYVYEQVASNVAYNNSTTYYTAENTAVYGVASDFNDGKAVRDLEHFEVSESLTLVSNLATLKQVDIVAIAWLDGTLLDDDHASVLGQVSLHFIAA